MGNKFAYQNMLNRIRDIKMTKTKNPEFSKKEIEYFNQAVDLCHLIVERRRGKFETTESGLHLNSVVKVEQSETTVICPMCNDTGIHTYGGSFGGASMTEKCLCRAKL